MPKINIVGGSYEERSLPFQAQRSINCFPVYDETGAEIVALYGTPGLADFATAGAGDMRGGFASASNRAFFVSGVEFYEVFSNGTTTARGNLNTSSGNLTFAENGTQIAICDGSKLYIFTLSNNTLQVVTDPDLPTTIGTVDFVDGYFVVSEKGSGRFYISALFDGLSWNALDFATAESSPDDLIAVKRAVGNLWLLGNNTIEIWGNTGASDFPFQRLSGTRIDKGCVAPFTPLEIDNTLYWLGRDDEGEGIVYKATGFSPTRISTNSIEYYLQKAGDLGNCYAWSYQQDGHYFYVITGGGLSTSLVFDITTGQSIS